MVAITAIRPAQRGRCWELSPVDEKLESDLITTWNLVPDPQGVPRSR